VLTTKRNWSVGRD